MSEGTLASAYVLYPFQTLVPRFQNRKDGGSEIGGLERRLELFLEKNLEDKDWGENLFGIQTEVSTWQVQGIYTK